MDFVVSKKTIKITEVTSFHPTEWMRLAIAGEKIQAIQALRKQLSDNGHNYVVYYQHGSHSLLPLKIAKDIVENFMACLKITKETY